jgi:uncharacterized protein YkwD
MKRYLLTLLLGSMALLATGCAATTGNLVRTSAHPQLARRGQAVIGDTLDTRLLESILFDYINLFRSKHNLSLFREDRQASVAATWMAAYQSTVGSITHRSQRSGMETFVDRYRSSGGAEYQYGGENTQWAALHLEFGPNFTYDEMARRLLDNWINSPEHLENLVMKGEDLDATLGIGIVRGNYQGWDGIYATTDQFFHTPQVAQMTSGASVSTQSTRTSLPAPAPSQPLKPKQKQATRKKK